MEFLVTNERANIGIPIDILSPITLFVLQTIQRYPSQIKEALTKIKGQKGKKNRFRSLLKSWGMTDSEIACTFIELKGCLKVLEKYNI